MVQHFHQITNTWALTCAHIETAGGNSGQQTHVGWKSKQFPQAESRVEMISGTGSDLRFGGKRTFDEGSAVGARCQSERRRMDDQRVHANPQVYFLTKFLQAFGRVVAGF